VRKNPPRKRRKGRTRDNRLPPSPKEVYDILHKSYGPQGWWPGDTGFEIIVGALLTQQTSWSAVEKAIDNLKEAGMLAPKSLAKARPSAVQRHIRCTGFYRQKTRSIMEMARHITNEYDGSVERFLAGGTDTKRDELLNLRGVGFETADSILLYVKEAPIFVVDAYTYRLFDRLGYALKRDYEATRRFFEGRLPRDVALYKELHALIDIHCKRTCLKEPLCGACPLAAKCPSSSHSSNGEANLIKH
jgi:endonuclease-3 related protein